MFDARKGGPSQRSGYGRFLRLVLAALNGAVACACESIHGSSAPDATSIERRPGEVRPWEHEGSDLPVDPRLRFGQLENGLRWVWTSNATPQGWATMYLHVNVGSLAEEDDELGMAHFVEHLAFNGTEHHPPGTLVEQFQRWGLEIGPHLNALTSHESTIYWFQLRSRNDEDLEFGFRLLHDFAFGQSVLPAEVEAEKGVVDAEERERGRLETRSQERQIRELFGYSRLVQRSPVGTREVRARFTPEAVRSFLHKWYRPENMTLIVVGDVGRLDPEQSIRHIFDEPARLDPPARQPEAGMLLPDELSACFFEPEMGRVELRILSTRPPRSPPYDRARLEREAVLDAARKLLNRRLRQCARAPDEPFLDAAASSADGSGINDGEVLSLRCSAAGWRAALAAGEQELRRAFLHGFTAVEVDELRADLLRELDADVLAEETRPSSDIARELARAAAERRVPLSASSRRDILQPLYRQLTAEQCRRCLQEAWALGTRALYAHGNLDLGADAAVQLEQAYADSRSVAVEPWKPKALALFAYESDAETRGEIVTRESIDDLGFVTVVFANGVRLNVKSTPYQAGELCFEARLGEGQLSLATEDAALAAFDGRFFVDGGLELHDTEELRRLDAGRLVSLRFRTGVEAFEFGGTTRRGDLLRQLELFCAYLQAPGWRSTGYDRLRERLHVHYEELSRSNRGPLQLDFMRRLTADDPRSAYPSRERLEAIEFEELRDWLAPFLADAPLEVALVGDLDVEAAIEAGARTLGALPPRRELRRYAENRVGRPFGSNVHERYEVATEDPSALVLVVYPMPDGIEPRRRWLAALLAEIVADRLRVELRERMGATYSPHAEVALHPAAAGPGAIYLRVSTAPEDAQRVLETCVDIGEQLATGGPNDEEVDRLRTLVSTRARSRLRTNERWAELLAMAYRDARALLELREAADATRRLGRSELADLAAQRLGHDKASTAIVSPRR